MNYDTIYSFNILVSQYVTDLLKYIKIKYIYIMILNILTLQILS